MGMVLAVFLSKIHVGITPQGKDLTESYEYNSLGNLQSRTLPVPVLSEGASGNYKQILKSAQEYYVHSNVCSRFAYEASHRNLLLKEFGVCASSGLPGSSGSGSLCLHISL